MATRQLSMVIQSLQGPSVLVTEAGRSDEQLLEDFICTRDEAALAIIVRRYAPLVWGVCRRVLRNHHDAEDAFQATFLVLVHKAGSISARALLGNWLYGVAYQTARKARATAARRSERERIVANPPEPLADEGQLWSDLQPLIDAELARLPDNYRAVVISCDLEGKTRQQTAQQLGFPEGTVAGWLARARTLLAGRLARRGVTLSVGLLGSILSSRSASAAAPPTVVRATLHATSLLAAGRGATTATISAEVEPSPAVSCTPCDSHHSESSWACWP
ncbi:MAG: sigma-70 family RNA polymerase sigma factor [Gemmataceae bacterium]